MNYKLSWSCMKKGSVAWKKERHLDWLVGDLTSILALTPALCLGADFTTTSQNLGKDRAVGELNA